MNHKPKLNFSFWNYRISQSLSHLGSVSATMALSWWIIQQTNSATTISLILVPSMIFLLIFSLLSAPISDRFNRKYIMIISDMCSSVIWLALFVLAYKNMFSIPLLIGVMIIDAINKAFFVSSSVAMIPNIVEKSYIKAAYQQEQIIKSTFSIIGGITSGLLLNYIFVWGCFLFNSVTYMIAAILGTFIIYKKSDESKNNTLGILQYFKDLLEGYKFFINQRILVVFLIYAMSLSFFLAPIMTVLTLLVKQHPNWPTWYLGALTTSESLGAILGAYLIPKLATRFKRSYIVSTGILLLGTSMLFITLIDQYLFTVSLIFIVGIGISFGNLIVSPAIQMFCPDEYRSRMNSIIFFFCGILNPLGLFIFTHSIDKLSLNQTTYIIGIMVIAFAMLFTKLKKFNQFLNS